MLRIGCAQFPLHPDLVSPAPTQTTPTAGIVAQASLPAGEASIPARCFSYLTPFDSNRHASLWCSFARAARLRTKAIFSRVRPP